MRRRPQISYLICKMLSRDKWPSVCFINVLSLGDLLSCNVRTRNPDCGQQVALTLNEQLQVHRKVFSHRYERADVSWCNEKQEMKEGHKCVWCMQGLMESAFASTLGTKQERRERHPSEKEQCRPNGEEK